MKNLLTLLTLTLVGSSANAAVVCEGKVWGENKMKLTVGKDIYQPQTAHLEVYDPNGNLLLQRDYTDPKGEWDGHLTGLITVPGLSMKYDNGYGCIRNVTVTANFGHVQSVEIAGCKGGSTPDRLCFGSSSSENEITSSPQEDQ